MRKGPAPAHWTYRKKKMNTHLDEHDRGKLRDLQNKWDMKYVSQTLRKCLLEIHRLEYNY